MKSPLGRIEFDMSYRPHFQDALGNLIRQIQPATVVETGVWEGLSSEYILKAMDDNNKGHLYSIDPMSVDFVANGLSREEVKSVADWYHANPIVHPRFTLIEEPSTKGLAQVSEAIGPVAMFIHDSDHSYENQTFEYEWAWKNVWPGGVILTDDPFWGQPPHNAWTKFLARHNLAGVPFIMGNAHWVIRP